MSANTLLPPATKLEQGNIFRSVCHSVYRGACMVAPGGGVCGCSGACVVAPGGACMGYDEIRRYGQ